MTTSTTTPSLTGMEEELRTETYRGDDVRRLITIPLVQNLIGGLSLSGLAWIALFAAQALDGYTALWAGLAGLGVACLVTIFRFFADDLGMMGAAWRAGRRSMATEMKVRIDAQELLIQRLKEQVKDAQRVPIVARDDAKFVAPIVPNAAWENARDLLMMTKGDEGRIPGRHSSGLSQDAQVAACTMLARAGVLRQIGKQSYLVGRRDDAMKALDALLVNPSSLD